MSEQISNEQIIHGLELMVANEYLSPPVRERAGRAIAHIRAQDKEIEQLKAQRKPTRAEVEDALWKVIDDKWDAGVYPSTLAKVVTDYLVSKGMVEYAPKWVRPGDGSCAEPITPSELLPPQPAEDDPLKVDMRLFPEWPLTYAATVAEKHNALVDYVKERSGSNERATSGAFDDVYARIAALEKRLTQPAEQEAWPYLHSFICDPMKADTVDGKVALAMISQLSTQCNAEFARIRTALGVKEVE